jgi:hypothetical protein
MLVHPNINKTVFKYDKFGVEITLAEIMDSWKEGEECLDCGFDAFDKSVLSNIMQYIIAVKKKNCWQQSNDI